MGAVRIYKESASDTMYYDYDWQVRSDGCTQRDVRDCRYGKVHKGYCNAFTAFKYVLLHLNDPYTDLGRYLNK